jgi:hypothetical protein
MDCVHKHNYRHNDEPGYFEPQLQGTTVPIISNAPIIPRFPYPVLASSQAVASSASLTAFAQQALLNLFRAFLTTLSSSHRPRRVAPMSHRLLIIMPG